MTPIVLGLDIGGANLKAATADKRAVSVPFALWKQPDRLPAALVDLVGQFPDATEFAVTMTGELCDCYETKRQGVNAILDAMEFAAKGRPARVWSTHGAFVPVEEARRDHMKVAAANWHALATFAGRYAPKGDAALIDIGSTTTDIIPLRKGLPVSRGLTDYDRLESSELVYLGTRRTPISSVLNVGTCAELFATAQDVFLVLGLLPEQPENLDTADGRSLIRRHSLARLARMLGGDCETITEQRIIEFAETIQEAFVENIGSALRAVFSEELVKIPSAVIAGGLGEFLVRRVVELRKSSPGKVEHIVSLNEILGPAVSACAPAYALAVLATERRSS